jgi:hypothetical protein
MGSEQVKLVSGLIWLNRSIFRSSMRCEPASLLGRGADWLGRTVDSAQMPNSIKKFFFFFKFVL